MALSREDRRECPVCYEWLSGAERTLSCGHVFCHDCLVKTLVTGGSVTHAIVCPVCRHLTFIEKQGDAGPGAAQTLEVPLPPPPPTPPPPGRRPSGVARPAWPRDHTGPTGPGWIADWLSGVRRPRVINPGHKASQIFVISAQGRPMAEGDALRGAVTAVRPQRERGRRICTTTRQLVFLLSAFTLLMMVAVTLPWVLLA